MLTFLWFATGVLSVVIWKWIEEGEPSWRSWTVSDILLLIASAIAGPVTLVIILFAYAFVYFCENYDREVFRIGRKDDE